MERTYLHTFKPLHFHRCGDAPCFDFAALLIRSEIAFDIHYFTYKVARVAFAEVTNEERKEVVLSQDKADWLDRHITTAIAHIKKAIAFAVMRHARLSSDEILISPHQFPIHLHFDAEWNGDPQTLCDLIHEAVVKLCLADWASNVLPSRVADLQIQADDALTDVHDYACFYTVPATSPYI